MMYRFANMYGCQSWHPDMADNSNMIILWGAKHRQARHIISARRRGANVITIDVRRSGAAAQSDEVLLIRPGSDAALALAVKHVIVTEKLYDAAFVGSHTIGFDELSNMAAPLSGCNERVRNRGVSRHVEKALEARPCRLSLTEGDLACAAGLRSW